MPPTDCVLLSDGPSDQALIPILRWVLGQTAPHRGFVIEWADIRRCRIPRGDLAGRIRWTLDQYPSEILFVHRDAEGQDPELRYREIRDAMRRIRDEFGRLHHVCVVPVRMQEAWLLLDESAIRRASGNPRGRMPIDLPRLQRIEDLPRPKDDLYRLLKTASGLTGRRLKKFRPEEAAMTVSDHVRDFSPLRALPAFHRLEADISCITRELAAARPA